MTLEGAGAFDRVNATGRLALNSSAASLGRITGADRAARAGVAHARLEQAGQARGLRA